VYPENIDLLEVPTATTNPDHRQPTEFLNPTDDQLRRMVSCARNRRMQWQARCLGLALLKKGTVNQAFSRKFKGRNAYAILKTEIMNVMSLLGYCVGMDSWSPTISGGQESIELAEINYPDFDRDACNDFFKFIFTHCQTMYDSSRMYLTFTEQALKKNKMDEFIAAYRRYYPYGMWSVAGIKERLGSHFHSVNRKYVMGAKVETLALMIRITRRVTYNEFGGTEYLTKPELTALMAIVPLYNIDINADPRFPRQPPVIPPAGVDGSASHHHGSDGDDDNDDDDKPDGGDDGDDNGDDGFDDGRGSGSDGDNGGSKGKRDNPIDLADDDDDDDVRIVEAPTKKPTKKPPEIVVVDLTADDDGDQLGSSVVFSQAPTDCASLSRPAVKKERINNPAAAMRRREAADKAAKAAEDRKNPKRNRDGTTTDSSSGKKKKST
jgi:hypothetical protein